MSYTIGNLKSDLEAALHGTTLDKVVGVNNIIQRAGSDLLLELDPMETKRTIQFVNPICDHVYYYPLPADLKGTKIIDIKPQANRTSLDRYNQVYSQDFDLNKDFSRQPSFNIEFNQGIKSVNIANNLLVTGLLLNQADSVSGNGTWVASGGATNVRQDNLQFVNGASSSVEFDTIAGQPTATLTNSDMNAIDMTDHYLQSQIFFWVYMPTAANVTSVEIRWGSDTSNYWSSTQTTTQSGTVFQNGWNLLQANWSTATIVGSPVVTAVDTVVCIVAYDSTQMVGFRLNSIWSRLGVISQIEYYSKYLFRDASTGAFQETITDDSNIINLDTETRNLLFLLTGFHTVQQVQGLDAQFFDSQFFGDKYQEALQRYKAQYKSEWQKPKSTYYKQPVATFRKWIGWRYNY